uniref:Uncharacterized protein n=1 Tax=Magnetococcus massalia (strain MO-1) TaxID=451514 RepID=A0A1S7LNN0_MAGMO|nr:membrane protein of unknown function. putative transporter [Candidatus Magnetococcus massalia]
MVFKSISDSLSSIYRKPFMHGFFLTMLCHFVQVLMLLIFLFLGTQYGGLFQLIGTEILFLFGLNQFIYIFKLQNYFEKKQHKKGVTGVWVGALLLVVINSIWIVVAIKAGA